MTPTSPREMGETLTIERVQYMRAKAIEHRDVGYDNAENNAVIALCDAYLSATPPPASVNARPICEGCKCEIDPDYCHCGDPIKGHGMGIGGHSPVPMGCQCGRTPPPALNGDGEVRRHCVASVPDTTLIALYDPIDEGDKRYVPAETRFVLASDYDQLAAKLDAALADAEKLKAGAVEAERLLRRYFERGCIAPTESMRMQTASWLAHNAASAGSGGAG